MVIRLEDKSRLLYSETMTQSKSLFFWNHGTKIASFELLARSWIYLSHNLWYLVSCLIIIVRVNEVCLLLCGGGGKPIGDAGDTLTRFLCSNIILCSCYTLGVWLYGTVSFPNPQYGTWVSCTGGLGTRLVLVLNQSQSLHHPPVQ